MPNITVPDQAPIRVSYSVGATDDSFAWPFRLFREEDIKVFVDGDPTPVPFSVVGTLPTETGATVVLDTPITNVDVVLVGDIPVQRTTNFPSTGPFPIQVLNLQMNEAFAILQEQETRLDRTLGAPIYSTADFSGLALPDPVDEEFIVWSGTDGTMVNSGFSAFDIPNLIAQAAASAAAAFVSETNAAISETNAAASEAAAAASAASIALNEIKWQGTYNAGTTYDSRDAVQYNGSSYISLVGTNLGNTPDVSPTEWDILALAGVDGLFAYSIASFVDGSAETLQTTDGFTFFDDSAAGVGKYGTIDQLLTFMDNNITFPAVTPFDIDALPVVTSATAGDFIAISVGGVESRIDAEDLKLVLDNNTIPPATITTGTFVNYSDPTLFKTDAPRTAYLVRVTQPIADATLQWHSYERGSNLQWRSAVTKVFVNDVLQATFSTGLENDVVQEYDVGALSANDVIKVTIQVANSAQYEYINAYIENFKIMNDRIVAGLFVKV
jgi:hypothetical protein